MDYRDRPIWLTEAKKRRAIDQKRACEAAAYPNMTEEARHEYMEDLMRQIEGTDQQAVDDDGMPVYTQTQEAEFAANRAALAREIGGGR